MLYVLHFYFTRKILRSLIFQIKADHAVVAVGLEPNTQLGTSSGLELHEEMGGFLVNAELEARSNLWVVSIFLIRSLKKIQEMKF